MKPDPGSFHAALLEACRTGERHIWLSTPGELFPVAIRFYAAPTATGDDDLFCTLLDGDLTALRDPAQFDTTMQQILVRGDFA